MNTDTDLAARIVRGVIAGMVTAVAAATAVGFWLSYGGLHDFAITAGGLSGPEAWAWPASIDLFIIAGEAGVTISALRHHADWMAWCYLGIGFAASVTGNVLHVHTGELAWAKYAVAAVPPMAAMLALAALLRHVYRLALDAHLGTPVSEPVHADTPVPEPVPVNGNGRAQPVHTPATPSLRSVMRDHHVGQGKAKAILADMALANGNGKAHG